MCEDRLPNMRKGTRNNPICRQIRIRHAIRRVSVPPMPMPMLQPTINPPNSMENMRIPQAAQVPLVNVNRNHNINLQTHVPPYTARKYLIQMAMKTLMLMKQNYQLQLKLTALEEETKLFMRTVTIKNNLVGEKETVVKTENENDAGPSVVNVKKEDEINHSQTHGE